MIEKDISYKQQLKKKPGMAILISDNIDFKTKTMLLVIKRDIS